MILVVVRVVRVVRGLWGEGGGFISMIVGGPRSMGGFLGMCDLGFCWLKLGEGCQC